MNQLTNWNQPEVMYQHCRHLQTQTMKNEFTNPKLQWNMWKQARWIVTCEYVSGMHYHLSSCLTVCTVLVSSLFLSASLPLSASVCISSSVSPDRYRAIRACEMETGINISSALSVLCCFIGGCNIHTGRITSCCHPSHLSAAFAWFC